MSIGTSIRTPLLLLLATRREWREEDLDNRWFYSLVAPLSDLVHWFLGLLGWFLYSSMLQGPLAYSDSQSVKFVIITFCLTVRTFCHCSDLSVCLWAGEFG